MQNSASTNENLSLNSSIISDNNPENSENTLLIYCADFSLNRNTIKDSAEILEKIIPSFLRSINTPILEKHGHLNTDLQALKNHVLNIEAQMSALEIYVKVSAFFVGKTK